MSYYKATAPKTNSNGSSIALFDIKILNIAEIKKLKKKQLIQCSPEKVFHHVQ